MDFGNIARGEVREKSVIFTQTCHNFPYLIYIEKRTRKTLAKRGVAVQFGSEVTINFDSSVSDVGQIRVDIPLMVCFQTYLNRVI